MAKCTSIADLTVTDVCALYAVPQRAKGIPESKKLSKPNQPHNFKSNYSDTGQVLLSNLECY